MPSTAGHHGGERPSRPQRWRALQGVFALDAAGFFGYASELLKEQQPHFQDHPILDRLAPRRASVNDDGSLDIFVQHDTPAHGTSNWLPAPGDGFNLLARLYYPKPGALDRTWTPPAVTRV